MYNNYNYKLVFVVIKVIIIVNTVNILFTTHLRDNSIFFTVKFCNKKIHSSENQLFGAFGVSFNLFIL